MQGLSIISFAGVGGTYGGGIFAGLIDHRSVIRMDGVSHLQSSSYSMAHEHHTTHRLLWGSDAPTQQSGATSRLDNVSKRINVASPILLVLF